MLNYLLVSVSIFSEKKKKGGGGGGWVWNGIGNIGLNFQSQTTVLTVFGQQKR